MIKLLKLVYYFASPDGDSAVFYVSGLPAFPKFAKTKIDYLLWLIIYSMLFRLLVV